MYGLVVEGQSRLARGGGGVCRATVVLCCMFFAACFEGCSASLAFLQGPQGREGVVGVYAMLCGMLDLLACRGGGSHVTQSPPYTQLPLYTQTSPAIFEGRLKTGSFPSGHASTSIPLAP